MHARESATRNHLESGEAFWDRLTDEELLLHFRESHEHPALEALVRRLDRPLYRYLLRYLHNPELAQDVAQATFVRFQERLRLYRPEHRVRPWLYSMATHLAVDALRRERRRRAVSLDEDHFDDQADVCHLMDLLDADTGTPLKQLEHHELRDRMRQAVRELPDNLRAVVVLVFFRSLSYQQAADKLGIPIGTVKSRMHKALLELNLAWQRGEADSDPTVRASAGPLLSGGTSSQ